MAADSLENQKKHWAALAIADKLGSPTVDGSCPIKPPAMLSGKLDIIQTPDESSPIRMPMKQLVSALNFNKSHGDGTLRPPQDEVETYLEQMRTELVRAGIDPIGKEGHADIIYHPSDTPSISVALNDKGMKKLAKNLVARQPREDGMALVSLTLEDGTHANAAQVQKAIFLGAAVTAGDIYAPGQAPDSRELETLHVSQRTLERLLPRPARGY